MLDKSIFHYREIIEAAARLMSLYFQKTIHFSKVVQLSEPERRNIILRLEIDAPTTAMPQTLILKKTATENNTFDASKSETEREQLSRFARDWAGLEFLTQIGSSHAPRFYTGSVEHKFILIEDLGLSHPSLVDPLTRAPSVINLQEAEVALMSYVRRVGKMHADTFGKHNQFFSILHRVYPQTLPMHSIPKSDGAEIIKQFNLLTGDASTELNKEIQEIMDFAQSSDNFSVLLHGDICPDNVYYQGKDIRLIDFEFSDFGNALIDGVYLRMCMPSCWCSKAIPETVLYRMKHAYREELKLKVPAAVDNFVYHKQLVYACAYWVIRALQSLHEMKLMDNEWICPSGPVATDSKWDPKENTFRPRILSRIDAFIRCAKKTSHLPTLCAVSIRLLERLKEVWPGTNYIEFFPVFKDQNFMQN